MTGRIATAQRRSVWLWAGQAAYLGPSFHLAAHSTPVHCLVVGVDAPFTVSIPAGASWRRRSALIPARTLHKIDAGAGRMLFYYFDPQSRHITDVRAAMTESTATLPAEHRHEANLLDHLHARDTPDPGELRRLVLGGGERKPIDQRIASAMELIRSDPAQDLHAGTLAAAVGLSTSRFLHLFSSQAGTSFRRYRLWARLLSVGASVADGHDLTAAAVTAGFASASHFSDTFRAMFGLTATTVLSQGTEINTIAAP
ncbi:AraC family transcriptional regulator [Nocardia sp. CDC159]|uniref:AraC family transcriptional regulator n=1 Tax=Nocardia pulmonis TaxID=2951408 RepID=A0A9X2J1L1_9NOCA|nr:MULTISPECIES: AraC family transcriptional regulator [Nocardia]MCM6778989.1 AraC family transcriptional regulator [Nocardia pulmonis]MCM6791872.1 AraC family transcriptional regulator [Nocardia sp. CDC159]